MFKGKKSKQIEPVYWIREIIVKITLILLLFLMSCSSPKNIDCPVKEVEIRYIDWSLVRNSPIPVIAFWPTTKNPQVSDMKVIKITDSNFLANFENIGDSLVNSNETKGIIDSRISCVIRYKNCSTDTLSFGRTNKMKFNSKYYKIDQQLLKLITTFLPTEQLKLINYELHFNSKDKD